MLVLLGAGGAVVWVSSRQQVPYTHRMHAILISPEDEKEMGAAAFKQVCRAGCTAVGEGGMPCLHCQTFRVRLSPGL